jgi:cytidine deaminase
MKFNAAEFKDALSVLPEGEQPRVLSQLCSKHFSGCLKDFESPAVELVPALLPLAAKFSIAPISGFHVGAVAVGASGHLYLGANMEFVGAPLSASLHAEQSAVLNAWMHGESAIVALAISEVPCGHCRQFLWELSNVTTLPIIAGPTRTDLGSLLPMPFGAPRKTGHGLLDSPPTTLESIAPITNDAAQRALNAAQRSYVPYTNAPEGFVIECADGKSFAGRAAESIAFNPSTPAAVCALNQRNLSTSRDYSISACTHAKLATGLHSQSELTATIIRRISSAEIKTVRLEPS